MGLNKSMKQCLFTFFKSDIYIFKTIVFIFIGRFKNGKKSLEIYFLLIVCGSETKKDNNMKPKAEIFAEMWNMWNYKICNQ